MKLRHMFSYVNAGVIAGACLFIGEVGFATPLLNPADFLPEKSWFVSVSGQGVKKEPVVKILNTSDVQVSLTSGQASIFSGSNLEINMESESEAVVANFGFKPNDGFLYQVRMGHVRSFDLEFSSGNHTNRLDNLRDGFLWGLSIGGRINPGSIVSVGISWQLDFSQTTVALDRFRSPGLLTTSNVRFQEEEYQGSVNFSKRWKMVEPYVGLKILRTVARMADASSGSQIRGDTDGVSPFVGFQWDMAKNETLTIETSFIDEKSLAAAIKIQF